MSGIYLFYISFTFLMNVNQYVYYIGDTYLYCLVNNMYYLLNCLCHKEFNNIVGTFCGILKILFDFIILFFNSY